VLRRIAAGGQGRVTARSQRVGVLVLRVAVAGAVVQQVTETAVPEPLAKPPRHVAAQLINDHQNHQVGRRRGERDRQRRGKKQQAGQRFCDLGFCDLVIHIQRHII
jgi:hypothetical protein